MTQKPYGECTILWQTESEDGIAEKPILIEEYSDVVSLSQDGESINVNYESIPELIKTLKKIKKGI